MFKKQPSSKRTLKIIPLLLLMQSHEGIAQSSLQLGYGYAALHRENVYPFNGYEDVYDENFIVHLGYRYTHEFNKYLDISIGTDLLYYRMQYQIYQSNFSVSFTSFSPKRTTHDYLAIALPILVHFSPGRFRLYAGPCIDYTLDSWHNPRPPIPFEVRAFLKNGNNLYITSGFGIRLLKQWELALNCTLGSQLKYATGCLSYYFNYFFERVPNEKVQ